jgi:hypothetical protein
MATNSREMINRFSGLVYLLICLIAYGCTEEGTFKITGELNLPNESVVTLWPDDNSHQIAGATIKNKRFEMQVEALDEGVYNLLVSWKNPHREVQVLQNGSRLSTPDTLYSRTRIYLGPSSDYLLTSSVKDISTVLVPTEANSNPFRLEVTTNSQPTKDLQSYLLVIGKITNVFQKKLDSLNTLTNDALTKQDLINYRKLMDEYQGLDDSFFKRETFLARKSFIDGHVASPVSAYLIATAPDLKENKIYYQKAFNQLDPILLQNRYTLEAKRRLALK